MRGDMVGERLRDPRPAVLGLRLDLDLQRFAVGLVADLVVALVARFVVVHVLALGAFVGLGLGGHGQHERHARGETGIAGRAHHAGHRVRDYRELRHVHPGQLGVLLLRLQQGGDQLLHYLAGAGRGGGGRRSWSRRGGLRRALDRMHAHIAGGRVGNLPVMVVDRIESELADLAGFASQVLDVGVHREKQRKAVAPEHHLRGPLRLELAHTPPRCGGRDVEGLAIQVV
ncbi:MAG TPA: hypothetical protein VFT22_11740, partial [Kofleriaceae bacterium]|nr:hypothetical protein [Kofleriaceae bacterium]